MPVEMMDALRGRARRTIASNAATLPAARATVPAATGPGGKPRTFDFRGKRANVDRFDLSSARPGDLILTDGASIRVDERGAPIVSLRNDPTGRIAATKGPVLIPRSPHDVSVDRNMEEAGRHSPLWFLDKVPNKREWDYKQRSGEYEAFGNFNYGAAGRSARLPDPVLLRGAGWAQRRAAKPVAAYGDPYLGTASYGDDPVDQFWIRHGVRYHDAKSR
jgi:hypothetical protein